LQQLTEMLQNDCRLYIKVHGW